MTSVGAFSKFNSQDKHDFFRIFSFGTHLEAVEKNHLNELKFWEASRNHKSSLSWKFHIHLESWKMPKRVNCRHSYLRKLFPFMPPLDSQFLIRPLLLKTIASGIQPSKTVHLQDPLSCSDESIQLFKCTHLISAWLTLDSRGVSQWLLFGSFICMIWKFPI